MLYLVADQFGVKMQQKGHLFVIAAILKPVQYLVVKDSIESNILLSNPICLTDSLDKLLNCGFSVQSHSTPDGNH